VQTVFDQHIDYCYQEAAAAAAAAVDNRVAEADTVVETDPMKAEAVVKAHPWGFDHWAKAGVVYSPGAVEDTEVPV